MSDTRCSYCTRGFCVGVNRTKDHLIPKSRFGLYEPPNIIYACYTCNQWKGDKSLKVVAVALRKGNIRPPYSRDLVINMICSIKDLMVFVEQNKGKLSHYKLKE